LETEPELHVLTTTALDQRPVLVVQKEDPIPTEQPIALLANEDVVVEEFPDAGPPGRGRINDTRAPEA
jgi:hypothetical protein